MKQAVHPRLQTPATLVLVLLIVLAALLSAAPAYAVVTVWSEDVKEPVAVRYAVSTSPSAR